MNLLFFSLYSHCAQKLDHYTMIINNESDKEYGQTTSECIIDKEILKTLFVKVLKLYGDFEEFEARLLLAEAKNNIELYDLMRNNILNSNFNDSDSFFAELKLIAPDFKRRFGFKIPNIAKLYFEFLPTVQKDIEHGFMSLQNILISTNPEQRSEFCEPKLLSFFMWNINYKCQYVNSDKNDFEREVNNYRSESDTEYNKAIIAAKDTVEELFNFIIYIEACEFDQQCKELILTELKKSHRILLGITKSETITTSQPKTYKTQFIRKIFLEQSLLYILCQLLYFSKESVNSDLKNENNRLLIAKVKEQLLTDNFLIAIIESREHFIHLYNFFCKLCTPQKKWIEDEHAHFSLIINSVSVLSNNVYFKTLLCIHQNTNFGLFYEDIVHEDNLINN